MIYLPVLQLSSEFRLQAVLLGPRQYGTPNCTNCVTIFNTRLSFAVPDFLKKLDLDLLNFKQPVVLTTQEVIEFLVQMPNL